MNLFERGLGETSKRKQQVGTVLVLIFSVGTALVLGVGTMLVFFGTLN